MSWGAGLLYISYDTVLLSFVCATVYRVSRSVRPSDPGDLRRVSVAVLIPARNEEKLIPLCMAALRAQRDLPDEIHLIDDGSTDATSRSDYPGVRVWKKPHTGKANSLNWVLPEIHADVIVTLDADTMLEEGAIAAIRREFSIRPELAAAGGILIPDRGERSDLSSRVFEFYQGFEYIRAFLSRRAWMQVDALLLVSGAFAAYRKTVLDRVGGYDARSLVEDYELIHRIHQYRFEHGEKWSVEIIPGARATTDVPGNVSSFLKQRRRWFGGFIQTHFRYAKMIGNPSYGNVGKLMLPVKSFDTLQPVYGVVALITLIFLIATHRPLGRVILVFLGLKIAIDLVFHYFSVWLYYRWALKPISFSVWFLATIATFTEPVSFQLLRHLGAIWGWFVAFKNKNDWTVT